MAGSVRDLTGRANQGHVDVITKNTKPAPENGRGLFVEPDFIPFDC
jgi:hypothetical protein